MSCLLSVFGVCGGGARIPVRRSPLALCDWRRFSEIGLGGWGDGSATRRVIALLDKLDGGAPLKDEQAYIEAMKREYPV